MIRKGEKRGEKGREKRGGITMRKEEKRGEKGRKGEGEKKRGNND